MYYSIIIKETKQTKKICTLTHNPNKLKIKSTIKINRQTNKQTYKSKTSITQQKTTVLQHPH